MSRAFLFSIAMTAAVLIPALAPAQDQVKKSDEDEPPKAAGGGVSAGGCGSAREANQGPGGSGRTRGVGYPERRQQGAVVFLDGSFCALWGRTPAGVHGSGSSWGLLFSVITVIVLLAKKPPRTRSAASVGMSDRAYSKPGQEGAGRNWSIPSSRRFSRKCPAPARSALSGKRIALEYCRGPDRRIHPPHIRDLRFTSTPSCDRPTGMVKGSNPFARFSPSSRGKD